MKKVCITILIALISILSSLGQYIDPSKVDYTVGFPMFGYPGYIEPHNNPQYLNPGAGTTGAGVTINGEKIPEGNVSNFGFYIVAYLSQMNGNVKQHETLGDVFISSISESDGAKIATFSEKGNNRQITKINKLEDADTREYTGLGVLVNFEEVSNGAFLDYIEIIVVNKESGYCMTTGPISPQIQWTDINIIDPTAGPQPTGPVLSVNNLGSTCFPGTFDLNEAIDWGTTTAGATITFYEDAAGTTPITGTGITKAGLQNNPAAPTTLKFYAKASNADGDSEIKEFTAICNPKPVLTLTSDANGPVCSKANVLLTASQVGTSLSLKEIVFYEGNTAIETVTGPVTSGTKTITPLVDGTYKAIAATYDSQGGCKDTTASLTINVINLNPAAAGRYTIVADRDPVEICPGETVELKAEFTPGNEDASVNFVWRSDNDSNVGTIGTVSKTLQVNPSVPGSYKYTVRGKIGNCEHTTSRGITVTVNPLPDFTVTNPATACIGDQVDITDAGLITSAAGNYTWTYFASDQTTELTGNQPKEITTAGDYYIKGTSDKGCSVMKKVTVSFHPALPNQPISYTGSSSVCANESVQLTAMPSSGYTYTWSTGDATATINPTIAVGENKFTVEISDGNCSIEQNITITGLDSPEFDLNNPADACKGDQIALQVSNIDWKGSAGTYAWSCDNAGATIDDPSNASTTAALGGGANKFTVRATNGGGCWTEKSVDVTGNELKVTNFWLVNSASLAPGATIQLRAIVEYNGSAVASGVSYVFSRIDPDPLTPLPSTNNQCFVIITDTTDYEVTATYNGCSATASLTVDVIPDPLKIQDNEIKGEKTVCYGELPTTPLYVKVEGGIPGYSYTWTYNSSIFTVSDEGDSLRITAIDYSKISGAGEAIKLVVEDASGKKLPELTTFFKVEALPEIKINGEDNNSTLYACLGGQLTLTATIGGSSSGAGLSFAWDGFTGNPITINADAVGTTQYEVTGTKGNCSNTAMVSVEVRDLPVISLATADGENTVCQGGSLELVYTANPSTNVKVEWLGGAASHADNTNNITVNPVSSTGTDYIARITDNTTKCINYDTITLYQREKAALVVSSDLNGVCPGTEINLAVSGGDTDSYVWAGPGVTPDVTDNSRATALITAHSPFGYTFTVNGNDIHGCVASEGSITINTTSAPVINLQKSTLLGCAGSSVDIKDALNPGYTGTPVVLDDQDNPISGTIVTQDGTYKIYLSGGTCKSETKEVKVEFRALPTITLTESAGKTTVCSGEQITLVADGAGSGGKYSFDGVSFSINATKTITLTYDQQNNPQKFTVTGRNDIGCENVSAELQITVNPKPVITIDGPTEICSGQEITLSVNPIEVAAMDYQWQNNASNNQPTFTFIPSAGAQIKLLATNKTTGCSTEATYTVPAITPAPSLTILTRGHECSGTEIDLKNYVVDLSGTLTLKFYNDINKQQEIVAVGNKVPVYPKSSATYYVEGISGAACNTPLYPISVGVKDAPEVEIITDPVVAEICPGEEIELTANVINSVTATQYRWISGDGITTPVTGQSVTVTPQTGGDYIVEVQGNGCSTYDTIGIVLKQAPKIDWDQLVTSDEVNAGDDVILGINLISGSVSDYRWIGPDGIVHSTGNVNSYTYDVGVTQNPSRFKAVAEGTNGCISDTIYRDVTVIPVGGILEVNITYNGGVLCAGGVQILTAKATKGSGTYTYKWYNSLQPASVISTEKIFTVTSPGTYYVVAYDGTQEATSTSVVISKNDALTAPVVVTTDLTIPSNTSTLLNAVITNPESSAVYSWNWSPEDKLVSGKNTGNPVTAALTATTNYEVYVENTANHCISTKENLRVNVDDVNGFLVLASADDNNICINNSTVLHAETTLPGTPNVTYSWEPAAMLDDATEQSPRFLATSAGEYTFKVTATYNGHKAFHQVKVTVSSDNAPALSFNTNEDKICEGTALSVNSDIPATYTWIIDGEKKAETSGSYQLALSNNPYDVMVIAEAGSCSSDTLSGTFTVHAKPTVQWEDDLPTVGESGSQITIAARGDKNGYQYNWVVNNVNQSTKTESITWTVNSDLVFKVSVTDPATKCESNQITHEVEQIAPTGDIIVDVNGNTHLLCDGGIAVLAVTNIYGGTPGPNGTYNYQWYKGAGTGKNKLEGETNSSLVVSTEGKYILIAKDKNGKASNEVVINVNTSAEKAPVAVGESLIGEKNSSVTLYSSVSGGTQPYSYSWQPQDKVIQPNVAFPTTFPLAQNTDFTYYVKDANGCTSQIATVQVEVFDAGNPDLFTIAAEAAPQNICVGNTSVLTAAPVGNVSGTITYEWMPNDGRLSVTNNNTTIFTPQAGDEGKTFTYGVKATRNGYSVATQVMIMVGNQTIPQLDLSSAGDCSGDLLTVAVKPGYTGSTNNIRYYWYVGDNSTPVQTGANTTYALDYTDGSPQAVKVYAQIPGNSCKTDTVRGTFVRHQRPTVTLSVSPTGNITEGDDFTVTANPNPANVSYTWVYTMPDGTIDNSNTSNNKKVFGAGVGPHTFEVTVKTQPADGGCVSTSVMETVTVLPAGNVMSLTLSAYQATVCNGGSVNVVATVNNPPARYTVKWYRGSVAPANLVAEGENVFLTPNAQVQEFIVVATNEDDATETATEKVTVTRGMHLAPQVGGTTFTHAANTPATLPSIITRAGVGTLTYVWGNDNGLIPAGETDKAYPTTNSLAASSDLYKFPYYVVDQQTNCISNIDTIKVNVPDPGVEIVPTLTVQTNRTDLCMNGKANFTLSLNPASTGISSVTWSPDDGQLDDITSVSPEFTAYVPGINNFMVTVETDNGYTLYGVVSVDVSTQTAPSIRWIAGHTETTVLEGDPITMQLEVNPAGNNYTYHWTPQNNGTDKTKYEIAQAQGTEYEFSVYAVDNSTGCLSNTLKHEITVQPKQFSVSIDLGTQTTICRGGSAIATAVAASGSGNYSYRWFKGTGTTGTPIAMGETAILTPQMSGETFTVEATDTQSGNTATATVQVNYNATTAPIAIGGQYTIAGNTSIQLPGNASGGSAPYTYSWNNDDRYIVSGEEEFRTPNTVTLAQGNYEFKYVVTDDNGCISNEAVIEVEVQPSGPGVVPTISVTVDEDQLCLGGETYFKVTVLPVDIAGTATFTWSPNDGQLTGLTSATPKFTAQTQGTFVYNVSVNVGGYTLPGSVQVTVNGSTAPEIEWKSGNEITEVIPGDPFVLEVQPKVSGSYTYYWDPVNPAGNSARYEVASATGTEYNFKVYAKNSAGCASNVLTHKVEVKAPTQLSVDIENADIVKDTMKICFMPGTTPAELHSFTARVTPTGANVKYNWSVTKGTVGLTNSTSQTATVNVRGLIPGDYDIKVVVEDLTNSSNTAEATFTIRVFGLPSIDLDNNCYAKNKDEEIKIALQGFNPNCDYFWSESKYENGVWSAPQVINISGATYSISRKMGDTDLRYIIEAKIKESPGCSNLDTVEVFRIPDAPVIDIDTNTNRYEIKVTWTDNGSEGYTVWSRKWDPYCLTEAYSGDKSYQKEQTVLSGVEMWTEPSNLDTLKFFYVTANRNICGQEVTSLPSSDTVGYHVQELHAQSGKAINYISCLFDVKGINNSVDLANRFKLLVPTSMQYWDFTTQRWTRSDKVFGNWNQPFSVGQHKTYLVVFQQNNKSEKLVLFGKLSKDAQYNLGEKINSGYIPLKKADITSSITLGSSSEIPSMTSIQYWSYDAQKWIRSDKVFGNWNQPFSIKPGNPLLFILSNGSGMIWPQ